MCGTLLWENSSTTKNHVCNCCLSVGWKFHVKLSKRRSHEVFLVDNFGKHPKIEHQKFESIVALPKKKHTKKKSSLATSKLKLHTWKPFEITPSHSSEEKMKHTWIFQRGA